VTTEGGLDVTVHTDEVRRAIEQLRAAEIRVSVFIDPDVTQVRKCEAVGADAIEINTGAYSAAPPLRRDPYLARIVEAARLAKEAGLEVLAGHGLTYFNVRPIVEIEEIVELNIGHSIVARAALVGLDQAVREMVALLQR
jgi:pyridoxine 5-phosphate synthase